jgi:hypothetical protein
MVLLGCTPRDEKSCPPSPTPCDGATINIAFSAAITLPYHVTVEADGGELWEFDSSLGGGIDAVPGASDYRIDADLWDTEIDLNATSAYIPGTLHVVITRPVGGYLPGTEADPSFRAEGCFDLEYQSYDADFRPWCELLCNVSENQLDVAAPVPPTCTF